MGAAAAAAIIAKEKHIVEAYRAAHALTPSDGASPDTLGVHDGIALRRLKERAVLRDAGSGRLYLDNASWEALRALRRRLALVMTLVAVLMVLITIFAVRR